MSAPSSNPNAGPNPGFSVGGAWTHFGGVLASNVGYHHTKFNVYRQDGYPSIHQKEWGKSGGMAHGGIVCMS